MLNIAYFDETVGGIYDAALDPSRWPEAIGRAVEYIGGAAGCLIIRDSVAQTGAIVHGWGDEPAYRQLYLDQYATMDPGESLFFCQEVGSVLHYPDFVAKPEFESSRFYQEYLLPQRWGDGFFACLARFGTSVVAFAMARPIEDGSPYETVRDRVAHLVPHLRRAALLGSPGTDAQRRTKDLAETLDGLSAGVFIATGGRKILHANSAGYIMLNSQSPFRLNAGRLVAEEKAGESALELCFALAEKDGARRTEAVSMPILGSDGMPYVVHAIPLVADWGLWDYVPVTARVALFVHTVAERQFVPKETIATLFGLTPTELRVFSAIVEVGGVPEVASLLGIAESTVKTHLHRVFAKTGATRQVDLANIFSRFTSPFRTP